MSSFRMRLKPTGGEKIRRCYSSLSISGSARRLKGVHERFTKPYWEVPNVKYLLLVYTTGEAMNEGQREHCYGEARQLAQDLHAQGKFLGANPLHPVATATSVRIRGGKRFVTDGPFAETREQLGGYFLIDATHLDDAIAIAARIPAARYGTIEIRPVREIPGLLGDNAS
jgi:hypothetical protein